ncbi:unnamed protein product [Macrosiphum euphorbiae]|uniref:Uncharacterized protein n=1 Tax=Macrosiphum euphorbiae TaxID=13131 RepID=A0AAV0XAB5_9HEMI|nr:unnamed protein product [Macrosiphum euphorbiae]
MILGFFYGLFLSLILYHFVIVDLEFTDQTTRLMGIVISLFLSIGHAISQQVRCLGLLAMPTFCDKSGQRVLVTMVFAYVMAGPLNNIMRNGSEVIRVFTCSSALVFNLTKVRYELMFKPFQEALFNLRAETNEIKETINSINDVIDPIRQEFESDSDDIVLHERNDYLDDLEMKPSQMYNSKSSGYTKNMYKIPEPSEVETKYRDKLSRKCKGIITRADDKCKAAFQTSYNICKDSVHWSVNWALCWPMQVTFVCNLAPRKNINIFSVEISRGLLKGTPDTSVKPELFGGGDVCDSGTSVNSGFGKGYVYLTKSKDELKREFLHVKVNYKLNKVKIMVMSAHSVRP